MAKLASSSHKSLIFGKRLFNFDKSVLVIPSDFKNSISFNKLANSSGRAETPAIVYKYLNGFRDATYSLGSLASVPAQIKFKRFANVYAF